MAPNRETPHTCPPCRGTGLVTRPPGIAGDQESWVSTGVGPYRCRACGGCGWIVLPMLTTCDDPACDIPFAERPHTHDWPDAL